MAIDVINSMSVLLIRAENLKDECWQNFEKVIEKAKISAQEVGLTIQDHFSDVTKMILDRKKCKNYPSSCSGTSVSL
jgi:hypothetical protein